MGRLYHHTPRELPDDRFHPFERVPIAEACGRVAVGFARWREIVETALGHEIADDAARVWATQVSPVVYARSYARMRGATAKAGEACPYPDGPFPVSVFAQAWRDGRAGVFDREG